jgi:hypothetical protein
LLPTEFSPSALAFHFISSRQPLTVRRPCQKAVRSDRQRTGESIPSAFRRPELGGCRIDMRSAG